MNPKSVPLIDSLYPSGFKLHPKSHLGRTFTRGIMAAVWEGFATGGGNMVPTRRTAQRYAEGSRLAVINL